MVLRCAGGSAWPWFRGEIDEKTEAYAECVLRECSHGISSNCTSASIHAAVAAKTLVKWPSHANCSRPRHQQMHGNAIVDRNTDYVSKKTSHRH